jgi:6-pyruvoyltetrahydropterin/6-carboxytetrahydropterin synthase
MRSAYVGLSKEFAFEAAHHLPNYVGKCAEPHGHSYRVRAVLVAPRDAADAAGIVVDFDVLGRAVRACIIDKYDHKDLNKFFRTPTAEHMVERMAADLEAWLADPANGVNFAVRLYSLRLWETAKCWAEYRPGVAPW